MRAALLLAAIISIGTPTSAFAADSYAGQQARDIKALSADDVSDLLAGRGMGLAKPAELNHYPGPAHVLDMKDRLALSPEQVSAVEASFRRMSETAKPLGVDLIERERALDHGFASGTMTPDTLRSETAMIGELQGKLRAVHLAAHLETQAVLTKAQVVRYDELRGYSDDNPQQHQHHRHGD